MIESQQNAQQRINEVLSMRLAGAQTHDIKQYAAEQEWGVTDRQLLEYVEASTAAIAKQREGTRDEIIARHLAQRQVIYAKCVAGGDYGTALAVLKDEAALLSLYPKKDKSSGDGKQTNIAIVIEQQRTRVLDATEQITALPSRDERPATIEQSPE